MTNKSLKKNKKHYYQQFIYPLYSKLLHLFKQIFIFPIRLYQIFLSPLLGVHKCRFTPSCSEYTIQAIKKYGVFKGIWLGMKRISRCHPWGGSGYDPVK